MTHHLSKAGAALLSTCALVAGALGIAGCGSSSAPANTITLYNAQHEQTTDALIAAFTRATGIHVRVLNDDEDVLTAQIEQEGSRSPGDVFLTENSNWLQQLDDRGLLAKINAPTLAAVPRADSATNGDWVGVSARYSVLVYNPSKISASQMPTSILQLADPQYKGKLEIAPAETDFWPIVSSVARTQGAAAAVKWLDGLKTNAGSNDNIPDNETITSDVNNGSAAFGVINHYYYYRLRAEIGAGAMHAKLAYLAPDDPGSVKDISAAGILKSSTHQADAQKFLAFLTSTAGQTVIAHSESFEYPLHPGVKGNPVLPPASIYKPTAFDPAQLGTGLDAKRLLQQAGLI